ncbi:AAA family ATPase [Patescibacteria group bacterium]
MNTQQQGPSHEPQGDPIEKLKSEIKVAEVDPDLINLGKGNHNLTRYGDSCLMLPVNGTDDASVFVITAVTDVCEEGNTINLPFGYMVSEYLEYCERNAKRTDLGSWIAKLSASSTRYGQYAELPEEFKRKFDTTRIEPIIDKLVDAGIEGVPDDVSYKQDLERAHENCTVQYIQDAISKNPILNVSMIPVAIKLTLLSPDKQFLFFESVEGDVGVYKIVDETGNLLPVNKWEFQQFSDLSEFKKDIKKFPSIKPHTLDSKKSAQIPELEYQVELKASIDTVEIYDKDDSPVEMIHHVMDFAQDPQNPEIFYFAKHETEVIEVWDFKQGKMIAELHAPSEVRSISIDNQNNVLICSVHSNEGQKAMILSKTTGEALYDFEVESRRPPVIAKDGTIIIPQKDGKPRAFRTNLNKFEEGIVEIVDQAQKQEELLSELEGQGKSPEEIQIVLEKLRAERAATQAETEEVVAEEKGEDPRIKKFKKQIKGMYKDRINVASGDMAELKMIEQELADLKSGQVMPVLREFPQILTPMEDLLEKKLGMARLAEIQKQFIETAKRAEEAEDFDEMKAMEEELSGLMKKRRRFKEDFNGEELDAKKVLDELRAKLRNKEKEIKANILERLEKQYVAVETAFEEIDTIAKLEESHGLRELAKMDDLFKLIDDKDILRDWHKRLRDLRTATRDRIKQKVLAEEEREKMRERAFIESINQDVEFVDDELDSLESEDEIDKYFKTSPLVARIRERIKKVDPETGKGIWGKVKKNLADRKNELQVESEMIKEGGEETSFGFPVFVPEEPKIEVVIEPLRRNSKMGKLFFRSNFGGEFMPNVGAIPVDKNDKETREVIDLYREDAKYELFGEEAEKVRSLVPEMNKEWKISRSVNGNLEKMSSLLKKQMRRQNGILLLVGEAGAGKNVLGDIFCKFTDRELFEFSCNKQTEKEDVQFSFEFDMEKGTLKNPSAIIKALQTPGAVIAFDEINTLPPGVTKILNPLFDHRRKLIMPDGTVIKAHPSVIILGYMNPGNYIGTNPLPQEIRSRARMMHVGYPEDDMDEAVMYSPLVDSLKGTSLKQFEAYWKKVFDGVASDEADKVESAEADKMVRNMKEMIRIANKMRVQYKDTQMGTADAGTEINFIFSLRDGGQVIEELEDSPNLTVKEAMKRIIIPKIDDPEEEQIIELLIDNA